MTELRAGGTDLSERRRSGVSTGPILDIGYRPELRRIDRAADGSTRIGALVPIATVAAAPEVRADYPGLAAAAGGLATPQIRRVGTIGGNLLQRNRCWYYRNPGTGCLKKGGEHCPARTGNHRYHVLFDLGPCVVPHPSTLGAALLAYGAGVETDRRVLSVGDVFGDGRDGTRDHLLAPDELLTHVTLPPPVPGEHAAYFRAISRTYAEWPLVEAVVRLILHNGLIAHAAVAVGGVAPVPLRLPVAEAVLTGQPVSADVFAAAGTAATDGANPLPQTGFKLALLAGTVTETLHRAVDLR
jgi:xanthine dehydrogenase YagS FAD-binding subunit